MLSNSCNQTYLLSKHPHLIVPMAGYSANFVVSYRFNPSLSPSPQLEETPEQGEVAFELHSFVYDLTVTNSEDPTNKARPARVITTVDLLFVAKVIPSWYPK